MKAKEKPKKVVYKSIKIREEHYNLVRDNKEKTGVNIDYFVGKLISEKLQNKKNNHA